MQSKKASSVPKALNLKSEILKSILFFHSFISGMAIEC